MTIIPPDADIIVNALRRIVQALRHSSNECKEFSGLTGAQFFVLKQVQAKNGLSMNELAELTCTHQSTVSEVVGRLEAKKLVARRKSSEDGRKIEITVTPKGARKLGAGVMTMQERLIEAIATMPRSKVSQLAGLLTEMNEAAGFAHEKAAMFFEEGKKEL